MLMPSIIAFAQIGQNGAKMPDYNSIIAHQEVEPQKSVNSIFIEDFSGGTMPPEGWTIIGGGEDNWRWYNTGNAGGTSPEAAFAWGPPYFSGNSKLVSPEISTSGTSTLVLEFYYYVWDFAGSGYSYKIETTSDGGTTWNEVWSISPTGDVPAELMTLVIENEDVGSDSFQFAATFDGESANINYWYFDDFVLSAEEVDAYTVTFNVKDADDNPVEGAQVNMQSGGTISTNTSGEAIFENILPGEYAWWAMATGLSTEQGSLTVVDADIIVNVDLSISYELLSEYFAGNDWPPVGWSTFGDGQSNWSQAWTGNASGEYPELRFDREPIFTGNSKFVSPEVITLGYADLFLEFDYFLKDSLGSDYSIKVETTSDGGVTWNEVWSVSPTGDIGPIAETILISNEDVGSDAFQFAFTVEGNSFQINRWYIDDVILTAALSYDAALLSIDIPSLSVPGVDIEPIVEVGNMGAETISFDVNVELNDGSNVYSETITVTDLAPLSTETVVFPIWTSVIGSYDGQAYVTLVDDAVAENDEISFDLEVISGLVPKKPLYEIFTSSTCPPCVYANEALDALLEENPGEYTLIKYQVNWPGVGDPYYIEATGDRVDYYTVSTAPDLYVNAENFSPAMNIDQDDFDEFQDAETALEIDISQATINNDNMVTIVSDLNPIATYPAGLSARIAVVEKLTVGNVGTNGETEFFNVIMAMLPDAAGQTLDELVPDVSTTITESYDMNLSNMETKDDLAVVVFVQDDTDNSILQSAMIDVTVISGLEDQLLAQEELRLYPNPATDILMIESESLIQKIEIYNQVGQFVKGENTNSNALNLNIANLESGVYFLKAFSQGNVITKKFLVD